MSKIQFRELFTTPFNVLDADNGCVRYVKDTISRAIHNMSFLIPWVRMVVWDMSKIQFRELFTTWKVLQHRELQLCEICQRYNFESYSQLSYKQFFKISSCVRYVKDTISRAIHNEDTSKIVYEIVVWDMSKIQFRELFTTLIKVSPVYLMLCEICQRYNFESYSQLEIVQPGTKKGCVRYVKDTISRAIHNCFCLFKKRRWVVWDMSKIQFRELFTTCFN